MHIIHNCFPVVAKFLISLGDQLKLLAHNAKGLLIFCHFTSLNSNRVPVLQRYHRLIRLNISTGPDKTENKEWTIVFAVLKIGCVTV